MKRNSPSLLVEVLGFLSRGPEGRGTVLPGSLPFQFRSRTLLPHDRNLLAVEADMPGTAASQQGMDGYMLRL